MMEAKREPRVVIIGAGVAGIATAVTLQRAGFNDFTILEKGADVGGVWHWNRYPGLTCDIPSQLYQFSFAPKPDWTGLFAPGAEIQRYLREVVDRHDLNHHLRLNTEVGSASFDGSIWQITTSDGAELVADFLIAATGVLHHPFTPDIPGLDTFDGDVIHTARWDDGVVTDGRRIAVIGTGSTGVQVVSALQRRRRTHQPFRSVTAVGDVGADGAPSAGGGRQVPAKAAEGPPQAVRRAALVLGHSRRHHDAAELASQPYPGVCTLVVAHSDSEPASSRSTHPRLRALLQAAGDVELLLSRDQREQRRTGHITDRTSYAAWHPDRGWRRDRRRPAGVGNRFPPAQLHAPDAAARS